MTAALSAIGLEWVSSLVERGHAANLATRSLLMRGFSTPDLAQLSDGASCDGLEIPLDIALPNRGDSVAERLKSGNVGSIPLLVGFELLQPEGSIPLRNGCAMAPVVMVPEAAVHEYG